MHIKIMEAVDTTVYTPIIADEEDAVRKAEEFGEADMVSMSTVI